MDPIPEDTDRHAVVPLERDCFEAARQFQKLLRTEKLFIVPALLFSLAYCFARPVLVGLAAEVMAAKTFGEHELGLGVRPPVFRSLVNRLARSGGSIGTEALDVNR